jgi:hypothetical protein
VSPPASPEKPLAVWLATYETVGQQQRYTPSQIAEYKRHLEYVQEWLAAKGATA